MMQPPARASIRELFEAHAGALLLYARQWLDAPQAEDAVQEVFLRLLSAGRLPAEPRTWLFRCVRNAAISAWRTDRRRQSREQAAGNGRADWFVPRLEDRIDAEAAQEALRSLPAVQSEVVTLRIWSGLTLAEIGQVTGLVVSAVHHQYRAGLCAMRE